MKRESTKTRKQPHAEGKSGNPVCGTLTYLAECRGGRRRTGPARGAAPPDNSDRTVRK